MAMVEDTKFDVLTGAIVDAIREAGLRPPDVVNALCDVLGWMIGSLIETPTSNFNSVAEPCRQRIVRVAREAPPPPGLH
jgi:hypothetical protein